MKMYRRKAGGAAAFFLLATMACAQAVTPPPPAPATPAAPPIVATLEFEAPTRSANQGGANSIESYKGNIYAAWIDDKLNLVVAKKTPTGPVQTIIVDTNIKDDPNHMRPAIIVDKTGFVHVTGGMHHVAWNYYVSNKPEDISTFTKVSGTAQCPPGTGITYATFYKDNFGEVYITYRKNVGKEATQNDEKGLMAGDLGGAVARYSAETKTWQEFGGTDYRQGVKTLIWDDSGSINGFYQSFKTKLYFDKNNRMHLAWLNHTVNTGKYDSAIATYILYAYSDDQGKTFYKAGGELIANLPITSKTGSVVLDRSAKADINNGLDLGATVEGYPIVSTRVAETGVNVMKWNGTAWEKMVYPKAQPPFVTRPSDGLMLAIFYAAPKPSAVFISKDGGKTWSDRYEFDRDATSFEFDRSYFNETGDLRWLFTTEKGTKLMIRTEKLPK